MSQPTYEDVASLLQGHFYDDPASQIAVSSVRYHDGRFYINYLAPVNLEIRDVHLATLGINAKRDSELSTDQPTGHFQPHKYQTVFTTTQSPEELMQALGNARMQNLAKQEETLRQKKAGLLAECSQVGITVEPYISPEELDRQKSHAQRYVSALQEGAANGKFRIG